MKDFKGQSPAGTRVPVRSVSLQIRENQVTVKVRSSVPQAKSPVARFTSR